jgi:hypothetical protein
MRLHARAIWGKVRDRRACARARRVDAFGVLHWLGKRCGRAPRSLRAAICEERIAADTPEASQLDESCTRKEVLREYPNGGERTTWASALRRRRDAFPPI